jgi:hypothetical protein
MASKKVFFYNQVVKTGSTSTLYTARLGFFLSSLLFFLLCLAGRDLTILATTGQELVPIPTTTKSMAILFHSLKVCSGING